MRKVIKLTLAVALMLTSTSLFAQKFGRINTNEVVAAMAETKEAQTNLEAYGKELQDNIETLSVELNNRLQEYQKNAATMTDSIREMKERELQELDARRKDFQEAAQADFQKKNNELFAPIFEKARKAIDKVSEAGGFTAIFDTAAGSLAYFSETLLIDIAPEVKKELNITDAPAAPAAAATPVKK